MARKKAPKNDDYGLLEFNLPKIDNDLDKFVMHECPICQQSIIGEKTFCLKCGSRLGKRKEADQNRIIAYFDKIRGIMDQSKDEIENVDIISKLSSIDEFIKENPKDENSWFADRSQGFSNPFDPY